ncbi:hypothetical protein RBU49_14410 [Clostridium sp. MB40-C1]|uniref:hypothetical protein n=1 Tax=Clostridium sp. MB40-C1 TaxID=3070996 RepID=UPI0027DFE0E8|nr:hypothetical protein [Clostridium sp. MB40-C1]WMJ80030.1 hypothetical protein RBU49_14410 [Clostridium sp. MB40-C1]
MISKEFKMVVAQNCLDYDAKYAITMFSMGTLSESCNNCKNFINGECSKGLFDEIIQIISRN